MDSKGQAPNRVAGYAMAALLVSLAVMAIVMTAAMPTWRQLVRREQEQELVFRGQQYVRAIQLYQRKFAAAYPPSIDALVRQKFLRKKYRDPMVEDGEFEILYQGSLLLPALGQGRGAAQGQGRSATGQGRGATGQGGQTTFTFDSRSGTATQPGFGVGPRGGVQGVRSKNTAESIRVYNGATHYNEWRFVFTPVMMGPGQVRPGMGPGRGGPGGQPGMGDRPGTTFGPPRGGRGADRGGRGLMPNEPGGRGQGGRGQTGRGGQVGPGQPPRGPGGRAGQPDEAPRGPA